MIQPDPSTLSATPRPLTATDEPARRSYEVDPMSVTGAHAVVRGKYGHRAGDKPLWWVFVYHVGGKVLGVILTLAGFWLAKVLGLQEEVRAVLKLIVGGQ